MTAAEFIYTVVLRPKPLKWAANAIIKCIIPRELKRGESTIVLNPNDPVISGALTFGVYEQSEAAFFHKACRSGMTFVDVGANVGYYTALAIRSIGETGKIIAVEPDPENFEYLEKTVAANQGRNVVCLQKAASDRSAVLTLYRSKDNRGDNRLYANELADSTFEVETVSLDNVLPQHGGASVDLLKIDVQGYEAVVFEGLWETIRRSPQVVIMSEFWPYGLASAGSRPEAFLTKLESSGLTLFELGDGGRLKRIQDKAAFISRYGGRKYASLVALGPAALHSGIVDA